jgi:integrase/recombinase XerD
MNEHPPTGTRAHIADVIKDHSCIRRSVADDHKVRSTTSHLTMLKGARRGMPLSADGLDEILGGARARAGLAHATCHQLRHTCLTQLRKAGMSLEAVQAQAGHASIESTRIYLHLGDDWLASQYRKAAEAIDAQLAAGSITAGAR